MGIARPREFISRAQCDAHPNSKVILLTDPRTSIGILDTCLVNLYLRATL